MKYILSFVLILIFLVGCFSAKQIANVSSEPEINFTKVQTRIPGYTNEEFMKGAILYNSYCKACHTPKDPTMYSEEQWKKIVPNMVELSNDKKGTKISKEGKDLIYHYAIAVLVGSSN
jgi:PBP1b-binding outer membrane lipoprotein LpoB